MRTITTTLMVAVLALPGLAEAKHERVRHHLLAYDAAPDAQTLVEAAAPAEAEAALMEIHGDPGVAKIVRMRALDALGLFPTLAVRGYLHRLTVNDKGDVVERLRAATALIHAFGEGALTSVKPILRDPSADGALQVAVADAAVRYAGPAGRRLVREAANIAKIPAQVAALEKVLRPDENPLPSIR